ncbi:MAG TPA: hypothetical protein VEQ60_18400 [Longimicrobium sp.]|nr:hypothetical protein [Longimicrobium sp.]
MVRKLVVVVLLATLAACTGSITAADTITAADEEVQLGGGIHTSGG